MASVGGVSQNNVNSLYGNRNVITGLASGMDTESMIENSVSGIRLKISGLEKKQTKLIWQQEAYRSITDKMVQFSRKYASYTSSTNLLSPSFFNKAVNIIAQGANAGKVSATGRTSSDVRITGVDRLATRSRYQSSAAGLKQPSVIDAGESLVGPDGELRLDGDLTFSSLNGYMSFQYGNKSIGINFSDTELFQDDPDMTAPGAQSAADKLAAAINDKLADQRVTLNSGESVKASDLIQVNLEGGTIRLADKRGAGNDVVIDGASESIQTALGIDLEGDDPVRSFTVDPAKLTTQVKAAEYLSGKSMTFSLDGTSKTVKLPEIVNTGTADAPVYQFADGSAVTASNYKGALQTALDKAFGTNKIRVDNTSGSENVLKLQFQVDQGSVLSVSSVANQALGLDSVATSYLNTGKTLGDLLGESADGLGLDGLTAIKAKGAVTETDGVFKDEAGNLVTKDPGDGQFYRVNDKGERLYALTVNGVDVGAYSKDTALETVMLDLNNNVEAGVNVSYSRVSNQFVFESKETGESHDIDIQAGGLAAKLFGATDPTDADNYTAGVDAVVNVSINGTEMTLTRGSNTFDLDGMSVTVKGTFDSATADEEVTFTAEADADKIVDAVKSMVEDYNAMVKEIYEAYSTLPAEKSSVTHARYEPLTDEDKEGMTETAIKNYEEKAKQGLLFADQDLSSLYSRLTSAISPGGADGVALRSMGIETTYSNRLTTLTLDEEKLREALSADPDAVKDAFTKEAGRGSDTDGVMVKLQAQLERYSSTTGATKGILINKAGSVYAPNSLRENSLQRQLEAYGEQMDKWETKLVDQVDYYTRQFSRLEQLISEMNSQSSSLMSLMGGTG